MLYCFKNVWVRPIHLYVKSITLTASQVTAALFKITHVKRRLQYDSHMFSCKSVISCAIHIHSFRNLWKHIVWSVAIGYKTCLSMLSIYVLWLTNILYISTFIFKLFLELHDSPTHFTSVWLMVIYFNLLQTDMTFSYSLETSEDKKSPLWFWKSILFMDVIKRVRV